jgi:branched-chain amino acid transport system ATP-binding protein
MMAGMPLLLLDEPFERRLSAMLFESSLAHAHGLLDRVFVIDRGAVAEKT